MKMPALIPLAFALAACGGEKVTVCDGGESGGNGSPSIGDNSPSEDSGFEVAVANDVPSQAQRVPLGSVIKGSLDDNDRIDYYQISVELGQRLEISLSGEPYSDLDIYLSNSNDDELANSKHGRSTEEISYAAVNAGVMFVRVEYYDGSASTYELSIQPNGFVEEGDIIDGNIPDGNIPDPEIPDPEIPDIEVPDIEVPDADFCVENTTAGVTNHTTTDDINGNIDPDAFVPGACPTTGYVSKCTATSAVTEGVTYFSQEVVDQAGGHAAIATQACTSQNQPAVTVSYELILLQLLIAGFDY